MILVAYKSLFEKITKNIKSGVISSEGKLKNKSKIVWEYKNENCKSKNTEYKYIIHKMLIENVDIKIKFTTLNSVTFKNEYKIALAKYNEFINNMDDNMIAKAIENNDVGRISDISDIISFKKILELKDRFIIE